MSAGWLLLLIVVAAVLLVNLYFIGWLIRDVYFRKEE